MSKKQKKEKKPKTVYYDDGSTISDMSSVNRKGIKQDPPPPRPKSTFKERWRTYWNAVKMMVFPMVAVLTVLALLFLFLYYLGNGC